MRKGSRKLRRSISKAKKTILHQLEQVTTYTNFEFDSTSLQSKEMKEYLKSKTRPQPIRYDASRKEAMLRAEARRLFK